MQAFLCVLHPSEGCALAAPDSEPGGVPSYIMRVTSITAAQRHGQHVFLCVRFPCLCVTLDVGVRRDCVVIRTHDRWQKMQMKPLSDTNDVQCTVSDRKQCRCQHAESMNRTCSTEPPVLVYALS